MRSQVMRAAMSFPRADTALLQFSQNVVRLITAAPGDWGLVIGDVATYTGLHSAFSDALAACDPSVRNKTAVVAKTQARANLEAGALVVANKVYATATVTDAMKVQ